MSYRNAHASFSLKKSVQLSLLVFGLSLAISPSFAAKPPVKSTNANIQEQIIPAVEGTCSGQISNPAKLNLPIGKSTLIKLPEPLASRTVGNQQVVQAKMIAPQTLYLLGMDIGSTNMIIQGKSGTCTIIDVTVGIDPDGLQQSINELLPEEKNIKVSAAADSIVLTGTVEDALTANRAVDIAAAYVRRILMPVQDETSQNNNNNMQNANQQNSGNMSNQDRVNPRVINMLSVSAQQQVMLEVKIAEVSKSLLDRLGAQGAFGGDKFKLLTPFFSTPGALFGLAALGPTQFISNASQVLVTPLVSQTLGSVTVDGTTFPPVRSIVGGTEVIAGGTETLLGGSPAVRAQGPSIGRTNGKGISVDAEKRDGLVKILAEPSIMAISGQEGSFLAGGRIFIPVAQNNNGGGSTITLEEKEFGVGVKFTPTVLAGGRINLKVAPEVSELNREGVSISSTGFGGTAILPAFTSRKASTTVQLLDGQSFAIGGLIRNNTTANIKAFPILGEIPIIGALFRSTDFQNDKTELIFVVTPHLVKPLPSKGYELPTDRHVDPSRTDIFLKGTLEGTPKPKTPVSDNANNKGMVKPEESIATDADSNDAGFDLR
ncbi:MAG: type II and III secretion system protein family protein [Pseudomonadota bacterium]